jgi:hypothetical protein
MAGVPNTGRDWIHGMQRFTENPVFAKRDVPYSMCATVSAARPAGASASSMVTDVNNMLAGSTRAMHPMS